VVSKLLGEKGTLSEDKKVPHARAFCLAIAITNIWHNRQPLEADSSTTFEPMDIVVEQYCVCFSWPSTLLHSLIKTIQSEQNASPDSVTSSEMFISGTDDECCAISSVGFLVEQKVAKDGCENSMKQSQNKRASSYFRDEGRRRTEHVLFTNRNKLGRP
jgi:hypothetical protein